VPRSLELPLPILEVPRNFVFCPPLRLQRVAFERFIAAINGYIKTYKHGSDERYIKTYKHAIAIDSSCLSFFGKISGQEKTGGGL
jgi:hypothetical protein